jgi:hypothetical protein
MKRFLIFILLGPLIAYIFALLLFLIVGGKPDWNIAKTALYLAYLVGVTPAAITGLADWLFARRLPPKHRIAAIGLTGVVTSGIMLMLFLTGTRWLGMLIGLFAFFPAVICSSLSREKQKWGNKPVARMERSEIRGLCARGTSPGLRFAPSGLPAIMGA